MQSLPASQWLITLLIAAIPFGIPIWATASERTQKTLSRRDFLTWVLLLWVLIPVAASIARDAGGPIASLAVLVLAAFLLFFYQQALVRRAREAGQPKKLAYLAIVPLLNIVIALYLLVKSPGPPAEPLA